MIKIRYTRELVDLLATTDWFRRPEKPACIAILPFVKPEHVGVEIGVFMGTSSLVFLDHCARMYFIDPCKTYPESSDPTVFGHADNLRKLFKPYNERAVFLEQYSSDAVKFVPEIDFAFIDGNHLEEYVINDIGLYWPKIRSGGFLSGHDYDQVGVRTAVNRFADQEKLSVEEHHKCWVIHKP